MATLVITATVAATARKEHLLIRAGRALSSAASTLAAGRCTLTAKVGLRRPSVAARFLPVETANELLCFLCSTQGVLGILGPVGYPGIRGVKVRHDEPSSLFAHPVKSARAVFLRVTDGLLECVTDR